MGGDTRQIPPGVPLGGEAETCAASVISSASYRDHVKIRHLTQTMRNIGDPSFSAFADKVGDADVVPDENGFITVPGVDAHTDVSSAIDFIYSPEVLSTPDLCAKRAIITLHNTTIDDVNNALLERMPGATHILVGRTSLDHENLEGNLEDAFCMSEYLSTLDYSGVPSHTLQIKTGTVVMLTRA